MSTLLLRLAGPLQSWGDSSRFNHRRTREEPTKSGVLGLLAAADGRRRTDPIEDLLALRFGVRTDQQGTLIRDFQTEIDWRSGRSMPLTHRHYLADAAFLAALEGDSSLIEALKDTLTHPAFPLYLGRRACPPDGKLVIGVRETSFLDALVSEPWLASPWYRRKQSRIGVRLPICRDALPGDPVHDTVHDVPVSFDPRNRDYGWRDVVHEYTPPIDNPVGKAPQHDPIALLEE
ncbi:hypothetical protein GCM10009785_17600 [Brooklawnia cerclae]|uniref:CRISPR system Cascade subunit CasD n=1 Tax=Brooklawnia cerclae TaxID=349934 RepID=A0ABX0SH54_9ACTN|nr:type I-E CRISPR-associated protein Cas5/CasD [Brooklawnia cerclae]NIH57669.1 CRISPR system Cascade subunit CasD [Brooklawnia cerclae]